MIDFVLRKMINDDKKVTQLGGQSVGEAKPAKIMIETERNTLIWILHS